MQRDNRRTVDNGGKKYVIFWLVKFIVFLGSMEMQERRGVDSVRDEGGEECREERKEAEQRMGGPRSSRRCKLPQTSSESLLGYQVFMASDLLDCLNSPSYSRFVSCEGVRGSSPHVVHGTSPLVGTDTGNHPNRAAGVVCPD